MSALSRITAVLKYYEKHGKNSERVNKFYRNILKAQLCKN